MITIEKQLRLIDFYARQEYRAYLEKKLLNLKVEEEVERNRNVISLIDKINKEKSLELSN